MKKISDKQKIDIEVIKYFIPSRVNYPKLTEQDIRKFLEYSDKGLHKGSVDERVFDGFNALVQGKRWRGIHIHELWKKGLEEGVLFLFELKEDLPREVYNFLCRELKIK